MSLRNPRPDPTGTHRQKESEGCTRDSEQHDEHDPGWNTLCSCDSRVFVTAVDTRRSNTTPRLSGTVQRVSFQCACVRSDTAISHGQSTEFRTIPYILLQRVDVTIAGQSGNRRVWWEGSVRRFKCEGGTSPHMDQLEARIEALERAVTEGDHDLSELAAEGEAQERLATVEAELGDLTERVAELEAATQALRGYVGNVRAVNRDIEQRADVALAKVESLESAFAADHGSTEADTDRTATDTPMWAESTNGEQHDPGDRGVADASAAVQSGAENGHHGDRCRACGRSTDDDATVSGTDGEGAPFESVFETDGGHEDDDGGTFDRIRELL